MSTTVLISCGDSPDKYTPERIGGALLTASDLGADTGLTWDETQREVFSTREPENPSIDPSLWCAAAGGDELVTLAGDTGADVELSVGGTDSPFMVRQQAWANADVRQYFSKLSDSVVACAGATWTDSDGNSYTLDPIAEFVDIGDESITWKVTITIPDASSGDSTTAFAQQTAARFGGVMMLVQSGATMTTGPDATAPNIALIVRAAGEKMSILTD